MPVTTFLDKRPYTRLRGAAFLFLSENGHVITAVATSDEGGAATQIWVEDPTNIPCRLDVARGFEAELANRISERTTHILTIPAGVDVESVDRFAIDGHGTFDVVGVYRHTGETGRPTRMLEVAEDT